VFLIAEPRGDSTVTVVVAPDGLDNYPKYLVEFTAVYAYSCEEEAGGLRYAGALTNRSSDEIGCAYVWRDSPQAQEYAKFVPDMPFHGGRGPVVHYVLLGGDYDLGVVAAEAPTIQVAEGPRQLVVTHEV
jgi:hypothetical protein